MSDAVASLRYLIARTTANRLKGQVGRLRRPRYLLFLVFGLGYFWLVFGRHLPGSGRSNPMAGGMMAVGGVVITISVLTMWLFGKTSASLAFLPAEVQLLFPAPLTRRQLIAYRVVRSQLVVLLNSVFWTFLSLRFGASAPGWQRFVAAWALFSVLSLHPLALALIAVPPLSMPRRAVLWFFRLFAAAVLLASLVVVRSMMVQATEGARGFTATLVDLVSVPPVAYVVAPFRALLAPFMASSLAAFFPAFGIVLLIIAGHLLWIFGMNVEFEEVAASASNKLATQRARVGALRSGGAVMTPSGKTARSWLPLAPAGHPGMAIVWKNTLALVRTRMIVSLIFPVIMVVVVARAVGGGEHYDPMAQAAPYLVFAAMLFMMGPRILRNDLRQDLLSLGSLKTYPLSGPTMVAAQIASPTGLLTLLQAALLAFAYHEIPADQFGDLSPAIRPLIFVLTLLAALILNATNIAIQNGTALLFPAWVRLGPTAGGIEAMGQNLAMTFGSFFALALTLVLPAVTGGSGYFLAKVLMDRSLTTGLITAVILGLAILVVELMLMMQWFGRIFDKTEATALT